MKRRTSMVICLLLGALFFVLMTGSLMNGFAAKKVARGSAAEGGDTVVAQADHVFVQAATKQDSEEINKLLDADFTWTNAAGKTIKRAEVVSSVPTSPMGDESDAKIEHRDYGQVVAIMSAREKIHVLRVGLQRERIGDCWCITKCRRRKRRNPRLARGLRSARIRARPFHSSPKTNRSKR